MAAIPASVFLVGFKTTLLFTNIPDLISEIHSTLLTATNTRFSAEALTGEPAFSAKSESLEIPAQSIKQLCPSYLKNRSYTHRNIRKNRLQPLKNAFFSKSTNAEEPK
jgi:hypothetical protein